jgi:patatin-related protein
MPVSSATQELRFATAMTGGVSLAVWMGGVAREMNLLDRASREREAVEAGPVPIDDQTESTDAADEDDRVRDLYRRLLDELDVVVRIDVLAGTSAGGINAALLGMCHATGWDLGWLRDVWLQAGDIDELLRDPAKPKPPSLMRGDGVLLTKLDESMRRGDRLEASRPTTVHITTTLLDGETSRFTDNYGTLVPDVNHLGIFRFTETDLRHEGGRRALAVAARASASFPGAFEPAFLPYGEAVRSVDDGPVDRAAMDQYLDVTRSHWAADGGILANRPIRPVLDTIFERPANDRQVRRVLLYVVPDPGGTPKPETTPPDVARIDQPLTLAGALRRDVGAAFNQSIAGDLRAITAHNERVDAMRDSRLRLAELGARPAGAANSDSERSGDRAREESFPSEGAWKDYKARQGEWAVGPIVRALMQRLSTMPAELIPPAWKDELDIGTGIEVACCRAATEKLTETWVKPGSGATDDALATLGVAAYEGVKGIVVSLIQLGYAAKPTRAERARLAELGEQLHAAFRPNDVSTLAETVRAAVDAARVAIPLPTMTELATSVSLGYIQAASHGTNPQHTPTAAGTNGLPTAWRLLDDSLRVLIPYLDRLKRPTSNTEPAKVATARSKLDTYLQYLGTDRDQWRARLVGLHVMDRSMMPVGVDVDQKVELIQVSATTRTLLDPSRDTPARKLTGTQFHHFGAFYKSSWRANDWMWGRVDGAGWLVHVLLDPRRIRTVMESDPEAPAGQLAATFFNRLAALRGDGAVGGDVEAVSDKALDELSYLDRPEEDPPLSLPNTALWLAAAWQAPIVQSELPVVAREALATPTRRDQSWASEVLRRVGQGAEIEAAARLAVARVASGRRARLERANRTSPPPSTAAESSSASIAALLPDCPVPGETLAQERGEPMFTRTVAKAAAVATAAATAVEKPPTTIKTVFATARTTTLTGYRAANTVGFWPRRLIVAGLALAVLGGILAAQSSTLIGLTGVALLLAGLYVFSFGVWGMSRWLFNALIAMTVIVALAALTIPATRRALFGTDDDDAGWVSNTLVPWLRDRWWAILLVLAVLLVIPLVAGGIARWYRNRRAEWREQQSSAKQADRTARSRRAIS